MPFTGDVITAVGLAKLELPGHTILQCDGGVVDWGSDHYTAEDANFGVIHSIEEAEESIGDEAPGGKLTFLPKDAAAAATLSSPAYQNSRMRFYFAEVTRATGAVSGTPILVGDMRLDTTTLRFPKGGRLLDIEFITSAERLMNVEDGNVLSPRFHKSVWPGELGLDNATGIELTKAWGVAGPPRGSVNTGSSSSGGFAGVGGFVGHMARAVAE
jgi:hypothetical protein